MLIIDQLNRGRWLWLIIGGATAAVGAFTGCSGGFTTCEADKNCTAFGGGAGGSSGASGAAGSGANAQSGAGGLSGTSGTNGAAGEAGAAGSNAAVCDTTKTPTAESCLIDDAYGVFVTPTGDDMNDGSQSKPVKTISKAIELAQSAQKFVLACDATYDEQLSITAGVTLYGGFTCPGAKGTPWTSEANGRAKVAPKLRGIALKIDAASAPVALENFEIDAQDGVLLGESSIAAFVNESSDVTLTNVKLVAGKGVDGADGTLSTVAFPSQSVLNGKSASGDAGGLANAQTCAAGGSSRGGQGGIGGPAGGASDGTPGLPTLAAGKAGKAGTPCAGLGSGGDGLDAVEQPPAKGALKLGSLTDSGWAGMSGNDGSPGTPGQGGGGGAGGAPSGGGGGGGAGGCGGAGAVAGKAGGSSIALLVLNSTLILAGGELVAGDAGKGGNGVAGQPGQPDVGAPGGGASFGCAGGKGGKGGAGGASGGGAGGISVGIAWSGSASMDPTPSVMSGTTITTGTAGAKGIGGSQSPANDGIAGVKQDVLKIE